MKQNVFNRFIFSFDTIVGVIYNVIVSKPTEETGETRVRPDCLNLNVSHDYTNYKQFIRGKRH